MYYARLHDSYGGVISVSIYLKAFSEEVQRRGELLKTTIDCPLSSRLYGKR